MLTLPDATALVCARGRLMSGLPAGGVMVAVEAGEEEAARVVADRCGDGVQPFLQLLDRGRVAVARGGLDLRLELPLRCDGVRRQSGKSRRGQHLSAFLGCHVGEQNLAARRRVQRRQFTDPVVRGDGTRPPRLVDVDDEVRAPHGDVDGFADPRSELFADRTGLMGDIQLAGHRAGQAQNAEAQPVLSAILSLFDEFAFLEGREQSERRRLVHADVRGDLADTGFATLGQDFQHADRAVDRLHTARALTALVAHSATIRASVAYSET